MSNESLTLRWLRQNIASYPAQDVLYAHVAALLPAFNTLRPKTDVYTYDDGRTQLLLCIHGLLPISFRQSSYHIPIAIWVTRDYPREPPIAFVVPTSDMLIKPGRGVDVSGRCLIDYLAHWARKSEGCDLLSLVHAMRDHFSHHPPVYSKPKQQHPPQTALASGAVQTSTNPSGPVYAARPPPPVPPSPPPAPHSRPTLPPKPISPPLLQPPSPNALAPTRYISPDPPLHSTLAPNPPLPPPHPPLHTVHAPPPHPPWHPSPHPPSATAPIPARHSLPPGPPPPSTLPSPYVYPAHPNPSDPVPAPSLPPPSSVPAPPRPPNPELLRLHAAAHDKLSSELASLAQVMALDADRLRAHQRDLLAGEPAIRDEMARLEAVRDVCRAVAARMRDTVHAADRNLADLKRKGDPPVDELVCAPSIVHNQLVDLVAEDNAIEDTVYHLHRALNAGRIDLDRFLRTTRVLAEEQFMKRALVEKIQAAVPMGGWT
ncbi:UEV domain-containing protein [Amylostereum chailletii]|nr:UEV domain-containing protein [Amylostereum chailletii]